MIVCFQNKIQEYLQNNFNSETMEYENDNINKAIIQIQVTKSGQIVVLKINSKSKALEKEMERILKNAPILLPAIKNGATINTSFTIPFAFAFKN